jgi:hypothetical protein
MRSAADGGADDEALDRIGQPQPPRHLVEAEALLDDEGLVQREGQVEQAADGGEAASSASCCGMPAPSQPSSSWLSACSPPSKVQPSSTAALHAISSRPTRDLAMV